MERGRGCAFRCAAASGVNPSRFTRANCTHLRAATSCTAAAHAAALREDAPVSDGSQLLQRARKVAGATTHRPFWSMSRRVSDAPHMRPPLSQQRRRHGQRRPSNGDFKPLSLATSANALWEKGLCPPQGESSPNSIKNQSHHISVTPPSQGTGIIAHVHTRIVALRSYYVT